jgi:tellurite resistance protein TerC
MQLFHHLHYGLAAVLVFVGIKMVLSDIYEISIVVSLGFVLSALVFSVVASFVWPKRANDKAMSAEKEEGTVQ